MGEWVTHDEASEAAKQLFDISNWKHERKAARSCATLRRYIAQQRGLRERLDALAKAWRRCAERAEHDHRRMVWQGCAAQLNGVMQASTEPTPKPTDDPYAPRPTAISDALRRVAALEAKVADLAATVVARLDALEARHATQDSGEAVWRWKRNSSGDRFDLCLSGVVEDGAAWVYTSGEWTVWTPSNDAYARGDSADVRAAQAAAIEAVNASGLWGVVEVGQPYREADAVGDSREDAIYTAAREVVDGE